MAAAARQGDFLGRVGGDEFVVIAEGVGDPAQASAIAERLLAGVRQPIEVRNLRMAVGACVGIAFALDLAVDESSQLLARADLALYRAKQMPGSSVQIYDESLQRDLVERAQVEKDLRAALDDGGDGLALHYQPIIDAATGETRCVEALIRWARPGHGPCSPAEFVPIAEASELIIQMDRWVLGEALAAQRAWREDGIGRIGIAVNISGRHLLSGRLVEDIAEALTNSGADPGEVTLEITETVLLADLPAIALEIDRLRSLGVRVAIDDFGTGFTSLSHLLHLTVDEIKIDRSFVSGSRQGRDSSLVQLVIDIGHHLGATVVAEGVEDEEQLAELRAAECDQLQGFLIARPIPAEQLEGWLRERGEDCAEAAVPAPVGSGRPDVGLSSSPPA
jgi:predicted signal transduction protein with EAL and GGDEF domain